MHPIHDVDVILLLATTLSSKRRPAELVEIMAAIDLIQGAIPAEGKMLDSFRRLASNGLLSATGECFSLTPEAEKIMAGVPKKGETADRVFHVREMLADYDAAGEFLPISLTIDQLAAAILAHGKASKTGGKNLLMPKVKTAELDYKRPQWRPGAPRKRKD